MKVTPTRIEAAAAGMRSKIRATPIYDYDTPPPRSTPGPDGAVDVGKPVRKIGPKRDEAPPELWVDGDDGGLRLSSAIWMLWKAFQEQEDELDDLRARLERLETHG